MSRYTHNSLKTETCWECGAIVVARAPYPAVGEVNVKAEHARWHALNNKK